MSLFESGIRPIIDNYLLEEYKKVRNYGDYWSASSAGYCMRKVIFERLGVPKIPTEGDARKQRVFSSGHIFHDWIQGLTKEAGLSIAQELELQDEDLMIRGHIDDLVLVPDTVTVPLSDWKPESETELMKTRSVSKKDLLDEINRPPHLILYDYKTVNSRSFMWAKKNGNTMSYFHKMQLGTYMYMLRKQSLGQVSWAGAHVDPEKLDLKQVLDLTEARILKIEKDTLMMGEQQLMWDDNLEYEVKDYWERLNKYFRDKKLPPCTCADQEGGFMAKEAYNGYYFDGEPCSLKYYEQWKKEQKK